MTQSSKNKDNTSKKTWQQESENCFLVLWNDDFHKAIDVVTALCQIGISDENSVRIMLTAHNHGNSVVMYGTFSELELIREGLNELNLTTTIELVTDNHCMN
ncbi:MAG: ATP-dependent Clp protease adaptor ClpS [Bacteroidales bacterium]|jgi:ATP-dependent Clp protease adapter protein ClpS